VGISKLARLSNNKQGRRGNVYVRRSHCMGLQYTNQLLPSWETPTPPPPPFPLDSMRSSFALTEEVDTSCHIPSYLSNGNVSTIQVLTFCFPLTLPHTHRQQGWHQLPRTAPFGVNSDHLSNSQDPSASDPCICENRTALVGHLQRRWLRRVKSHSRTT
jgi:hypothetical protein